MIDFIRYKELKKDNGIELKKVGTQAVVFVRRFDSTSGKEGMPEMGPVQVQQLLKTRDDQAKILEGIDAFLADVAALGVDISPEPK